MKSILIFLLGAVVGAFGYNLYLTRDASPRPVKTTSSTVTATPTTVSSDNRTFHSIIELGPNCSIPSA